MSSPEYELAFTQTLNRTDAKTRGVKRCKPPNKKCGGRCIPAEWDCRLKGEGGDSHIRAAGKGSDPLSALSNVQRGLTRIQKGLNKGNFSELEGGRKALIRGAVKASPKDLKEKKELQANLVQASIGVGVGLAVLAGGVKAHSILMNTRLYRDGWGKQLEESVGRAGRAVLDLNPARRERQALALQGVGDITRRARRASQVGPTALIGGLPNSAGRLSRTPTPYVPGSQPSVSIRNVPPSAFENVSEWHKESYKQFWSTPRTREQEIAGIKGGYYFSSVAGEDYLRKQYGLSNDADKVGQGLIEHISFSMDKNSKALKQLASDRGVSIKTPVERARFADSLVAKDLPANVRQNAIRETVSLLRPNFNPNTAAKDQYRKVATNFDKFFEASIDEMDGLYKPNGTRKSVPAGRAPIIENAVQGHAEYLATRMYGNAAGLNSVRGPRTADLVIRRYYQIDGAKTRANEPWTLRGGELLSAASEYSGRKITNTSEAIKELTSSGAFAGLQYNNPIEVEMRAAAARGANVGRAARKSTFKFASQDERQSYLDLVANLLKQKKPDGSPRFASQESAQAAAQALIRKRRTGRTDAPEDVRTDKKCGKSGIPDNRKCTKPTAAKKSVAPSDKAVGGASSKTQEEQIKTAALTGAALTTAVGALAIGSVLMNNKAKVAKYRSNVAKSAIEAEKLSKQMEQEFREQAARRLGKRPESVTGFEASAYNFKDRGFDRGFSDGDNAPAWYGQTKSSRGAVVMLSYADDNKFTKRGQGSHIMASGGAFQKIWGEHDILPYANNISQPRESVPDDIDVKQLQDLVKKAGPLGNVVKSVDMIAKLPKRFAYLKENVDVRGFNPDAVRVAAFVAAQRRLTGKDVHIMSYSNGGNVASEALAILGDMGYRDVRVVNVAGPTFGIFQHSRDQMRTWVSPGDEFYKMGGDFAFQGSNREFLKNKNIPHGLQDGIVPDARFTAEDLKRNIKEKNSYLADEELQRKAYTHLTVNRQRSKELVNEFVWKVADNKPMEGDLSTLFKDSTDTIKTEFNTRAAKDKTKAKEWLQDEIEERMIDTWYGGYNAGRVRKRQREIRAELDQSLKAPTSKNKGQAVTALLRQKNKDGTPRYASREAAEAAYDRMQKRADSYEQTFLITRQMLQSLKVAVA